MKKLKQFIFITTFIGLTSLLQACNNDDDNINYYTQLGTITSLASDSEYSIVNGDNSSTSVISNSSILKLTGTDSIGQRILYSYIEETAPDNIDKNYKYIKILDIYKVLTKNMDTLKNDESDKDFGNDPIGVTTIYNSEHHLNIGFIIRGGYMGIKHRISLVASPTTTADENGKITLELRHNANNDYSYENRWGYVSYNLESIPGFNEGKIKTIVINHKGLYNDDKTIELTLKEFLDTDSNKMNAISLNNTSSISIK